MSDGGWIIVRNWTKFQHYGDRRSVPWIKVYTELNSDPEWLGLSTALRGMLVTIWLEYARSRGQLPLRKVMQLCGKSARSVHIESLNHAGFIALSASKPLALARSREVEVEVDVEKQQSRAAAAVDNSSASQPQPFKTLLTRLGVDAALRRRAEAEPERALACAEAALDRPGITNRGGYFRRLLDSGEWPDEANRQNVEPRDPAKAVKAMIRNGVIHDPLDLEAEITGYRLDQATADELRGLLH